ncbi:MAG: hypothetical protein SVW77_04200 [Candidatus Nanohaloarchaea archaeon]|nr:hypothetical protein [Candidatus Nanohaloarchaea archaeon]
METLVRLGTVDGVNEVLETVAWHQHGVEIDMTGLDEEEYREVADAAADSAAGVRSLHYGRTGTVSLQEWDLFRGQLDQLVERADRFGCSVVSVAPPAAEIDASHTVSDLHGFMERADRYADAADLEICFLLDGFMHDPEMMNTAFDRLQEPSLGVMVDLELLVDGMDPLPILEKIDVAVRKLRLPVPVGEVGEHLSGVEGDVMVVAEPPQ